MKVCSSSAVGFGASTGTGGGVGSFTCSSAGFFAGSLAGSVRGSAGSVVTAGLGDFEVTDFLEKGLISYECLYGYDESIVES